MYFKKVRKDIVKNSLLFISALFVCFLILLFNAANKAECLSTFFTYCSGSRYAFGAFLNTSVFFMTAGCGNCISNKAGHMNLGGEAQIYAGGFLTCLLFNLFDGSKLPSFLIILIVLVITLAAVSLTGIFSALLYESKKIYVLLSTFLVSSALIPFINQAITDYSSKSHSNLLALPFIKKSFRLQSLLPPSNFNVSFFIAVFLCILTFLFFKYTYTGRKLQIWGTSPLFAYASGFSSAHNSFFSLFMSSLLHGFTGFIAVTGTYFTCHQGFYMNFGWNALSAALLAGSNPVKLIFTSLLLSWLFNSSEAVALSQGFNFDISSLLQGIILFTVAILSNSRRADR